MKVYIRDGVIVERGQESSVVDTNGLIALPGLVDLHSICASRAARTRRPS